MSMDSSIGARAKRGRSWPEAFVGKVIFPVWARRDHPLYRLYRQRFERSQFLDAQQLADLQLIQLRKLLAHSYDNCEFYRRRFEAAGFQPNQIASLADIAMLPVLTKRDIQDFKSQLTARNFPEGLRVKNQTGGSTGSPLQFYVDLERLDARMASVARHDLWTGLRPGDWLAYLWGARLDHVTASGWRSAIRNELLYRRIELNTSSISEADWDQFLARVRRKKPRFLLAYAQAAVLFADYVRRRGITDIVFDSIITTAEVLLPEQRPILEETFSAKVFERYGCREVSVIASECDRHAGLHVNSETLLVEIVDEAGKPARAGRVIVTDLMNRSMPLIRYEIGDVSSWSTTSCPCGRALPLLEGIEGRTTDFLLLNDGRRISGPSLTLVVADMPDVRQVQFVQRGCEQVRLRVVPGNGYGAHTRIELEKRLGVYLRGATPLSIEEVESIASEISGKYRFVVSEPTDKDSVRNEVVHAAP
jgi:phenylacetate-CoA ligase